MAALPEAELERIVVEALAGFGHDRAQLVREADLEELNVDSLDLIELVLILEEDHGVVVPMADIRSADPQTLGDVLDAIGLSQGPTV